MGGGGDAAGGGGYGVEEGTLGRYVRKLKSILIESRHSQDATSPSWLRLVNEAQNSGHPPSPGAVANISDTLVSQFVALQLAPLHVAPHDLHRPRAPPTVMRYH